MSVLYQLRSVSCRRGATQALADVTATFSAGELVCVCGLNGAGKSTLIEVMAGILRHYTGECRFDAREVNAWRQRELARRVSFLPQMAETAPPLLAGEVVMMGRNPFRDRWHETEEDHAIRDEAMETAGCAEFRDRPVDRLSGGERQRVLFAAALAQKPVALLLDEPGTFIDLPHQVQMFRTLRDLCSRGLLCVAATHDLQLAASHASRIILLHRGRLAADASPRELLQSAPLPEIFGPHVRFGTDAEGRLEIRYAD